MSPHLNISAGELFDLIRPAMLLVSALISTLVFASARKYFSFLIALLWSLATFFLTPIVLPLYLIVLLIRRRTPASRPLSWKFMAPLTYGLLITAGIGLYLYNEGRGVDVHLARAAQAKVRGNRAKTIAEYQAALAVEDDPHTRKLLGVELFEAGYRTEALSELRRAEQQGEPDDLLILRIASLLDGLNQKGQARLEYQRFLESSLCLDAATDKRCEEARIRVAELDSDLR